VVDENWVRFVNRVVSPLSAMHVQSEFVRVVEAPVYVQFAEAFHLPITTLRDWEQHRSTLDAPARALLLAIERDPR